VAIGEVNENIDLHFGVFFILFLFRRVETMQKQAAAGYQSILL
jgi:hypothetical protein